MGPNKNDTAHERTGGYQHLGWPHHSSRDQQLINVFSLKRSVCPPNGKRDAKDGSSRTSLYLPLNPTNNQKMSYRKRRHVASLSNNVKTPSYYDLTPSSSGSDIQSPSSMEEEYRMIQPSCPSLSSSLESRDCSPFDKFGSSLDSPMSTNSSELVSPCSCSSVASSPGACVSPKFFPNYMPEEQNHNKHSEDISPMHEMLHVARECSNRDGGHTLTFGEFCVYTTELQRHYASSREIPRPPVMSRLGTETKDKKRCDRKFPKSFPKYQVFLGGSCNPTTWRRDVAMPTLTSHGISFYNPQVAHWNETLVELEYQAKQTASVLFFVFDSATRNVASMVEAGYMSGSQPTKLVMVVNNYSVGQTINDETITQHEYEDLTNAINMVQDLVQRRGVPVFSDINHALRCTAKLIRDNLMPQDLNLEDQVQPVRNPQLPLGDKLIKLHDAYVNVNSKQISLAEAQVAFKAVTNKDLTLQELQTIIANKKGVEVQDLNYSELHLQEITLSFEEFCCIVAEFKNQKLENRRLLWDVFTHLKAPFNKVLEWSKQQQRSINNNIVHDIYLGGSQGSEVTWREDIAVPLLRKSGVSYYSPPSFSGRLLPMEASHVDYSRVLLFVITSNTRGVSEMALAAHYIGLECNVVLCVQMLESDTVINDEKLSETAIKDYNRGRSYLREQANKDRIPVFDNVKEAVECAVEKCKAAR